MCLQLRVTDLASSLKDGHRPPPSTLSPRAHLAVQEAVEDRDKEALEGDKRRVTVELPQG